MPPRKRKPSHGPVRTALEQTLKTDGRLAGNRHAALVALCRVTADQVDAAGAEVSSRLIASYLSALKDLERVMAGKTPGTQGGTPATGGKGAEGGTTLGGLRALAGGKS